MRKVRVQRLWFYSLDEPQSLDDVVDDIRDRANDAKRLRLSEPRGLGRRLSTVTDGYDRARIGQKGGGSENPVRTSGARWGKGAIVAYSKFYVKFRSQIALPHLRGLGNEV